MKAAELEGALRNAAASEIFHVPCNEDEAEAAVVKLKAMTSRPVWMDGEDARVYEEELIAACVNYPIDVVEAACKAWRMVPQHGKWWPTEQDLRQQCEIVFGPRKVLFNKARALLQDLRRRESDATREEQPSPFANGKGRKFREAMRERLGSETRFEAYFHHSQIYYAGETEILVRTPIAESMLKREGGDLLSSLGISLKYSPEVFAEVRNQTGEEDTPEERAEVNRKFARLKQAIKSGESIERLRQEGVL